MEKPNKRPEGFKCAEILTHGVVRGPQCCGEEMADDGGCAEGCCDYYKCLSCGYKVRIEWPD